VQKFSKNSEATSTFQVLKIDMINVLHCGPKNYHICLKNINLVTS